MLACGRRWGKTLLGACLCLAKALEGGTVWWVAPDFPRARIAWRMMEKLSAQIPGAIIHRGEAIIVMPGGGYVQLKSAVNPDSLRGEGLHLVVLDECADIAEVAWTEALRPALSDFRGQALFIGTPKGRNWFYYLWQAARTLEDWESFQMPTSSNPHIPRRELASAEQELPRRTWQQEYLAKFVTFEGRVYEVFDPDGPWVFNVMPEGPYKEHFGGIDFGFRNPTAMVVGGEDHDGRIDVVDEVYGTRLGNQDVVDLCRQMTDRYKVRQWWADPAQPAMIKDLQDAGLPVEACPRSSGGQASVVSWEVRLVAGLLEEMREGQPAPALRFHTRCAESIREHDGYRYPSKARAESVEGEQPLKKDDHSCNAVQYMIHGMSEWYGWDAEGAIAGDMRPAAAGRPSGPAR